MPQYSNADIAALTEKMATERAALFAIAESLTEGRANAVPQNAVGEEQWTAKEQLAHLLESDRMHVNFARAALEQNGADITGLRTAIGEGVAIPIEDAPGHSIPEIVAAMKEERARALAFIATLSPSDFERTAKDNEFGELTVMQWLRSLYRHDRQHAAQIQDRPSDYEPRYLSGKEPEQRLARIAKHKARQAPA